MQKLSVKVIEKMIEQQATSKEIDFILFSSRTQADSGLVKGVYYKDVVEAMQLSNQQFYNVKNSLAEKGIIKAEKNNYYDHDITILDNSYVNVEDFKDNPYVNTNHDIFFTEEFRKMKAGAKLLALIIMRTTHMSHANKYNAFKIGVKKFFDKYKEVLRVSKRVLRVYLTQLRQFFAIGIKEGLYYITPLKRVYRSIGAKTETSRLNEHEIAVICRRNKVKITTEKDCQDTATFIHQYRAEAEQKKADIVEVVAEAIKRSVDKAKEAVSSKRRELQPKLIHIWVRGLLDIKGKSQETTYAAVTE